MNVMVPIALIGWVPVVVALFAIVPPKWATAIAFSAGWCFLPVAGYSLPGLPDYTKMFATSAACVLGLLIYHNRLLMRFRLNWMDLPPILFCLASGISNLANGLGLYDAASATVEKTMAWGVPYFVGRLVYVRPKDLIPLLGSIVACGLLYVPLCLWEVRMSPQLHRQLYGFMQHSFAQTMRFDGWRPMVFMNHGLQVGLWMGTCLVLAFSAWYAAGVKKFRSVPVAGVVLVLVITLILIKSLGALAMSMAMLLLLWFAKMLKNEKLLWVFPACIVLYLATRSTGAWSGQSMVAFVSENISADRAESLKFRFDNEDLLIQKAWERPGFGWGSWGRNRVYNESGDDITVTDGLWIIVFGVNGMFGLVAFYAMLLMGPMHWLVKVKPTIWRRCPELAIVCGLAAAMTMNGLDMLLNAMPIPVFVVATGALAGTASWNK